VVEIANSGGLGGRKRCVPIVGVRVVNVIKRRNDIKFPAAELAFEGAEVGPRMVWLVFGSDAPKVIPLMSEGLGSAHDFKMEKIGRHHITIFVH